MTESDIVLDIQTHWWILTCYSESLFSFSVWILIFFLGTTSSSSALPSHSKWQLHFSRNLHWKRWGHSTFKLSANFSVITCNIYIPHPDTLPLVSTCTFFFAWNSFPPDSHVGYSLTSLKSFFKSHLRRRSFHGDHVWNSGQSPSIFITPSHPAQCTSWQLSLLGTNTNRYTVVCFLLRTHQ